MSVERVDSNFVQCYALIHWHKNVRKLFLQSECCAAQESSDAVRSLPRPEDSVQVHYKYFLSKLQDLMLRSITISITITYLTNVT